MKARILAIALALAAAAAAAQAPQEGVDVKKSRLLLLPGSMLVVE